MINLLSRILGLPAAEITEAFILFGYAMGGALAGFAAIYAAFALGFWVRDLRAAAKRRRSRPVVAFKVSGALGTA